MVYQSETTVAFCGVDVDNVYSPPGAELEQQDAPRGGRRLPPGWGPIEVLQTSWELMQRDLGTWIAVAGISFVVSLVFNLLTQGASLVSGALASAADLDPTLAGVVSAGILVLSTGASWLTNIYLYVGQARMALASTRGQPITLGTLFSGYDVLLPALGASVLVGLGTFAGILFLVIPGVMFAMGATLYLYVLVDRQTGAVESIQESWRITDGSKGTIFITFLAIGLIMTLFGCLTCGLGFLAFAPLYAIGLGLIYQTLAFPAGDSV